MRWTTIFTTLVVLVLLGLATNHPAVNEPDPVVESFERMLDHKPPKSANPRREAIDTDELYRIVNSVHWRECGQHVDGCKEPTQQGDDHEEQTSN